MINPRKLEPSASVPKRMKVSPSRSSRLMDPKEAAEYLHLEARTIKDWARKGYIPGHPLGEGKRRIWRFLDHELMDWLNSQTNRANRM